MFLLIIDSFQTNLVRRLYVQMSGYNLINNNRIDDMNEKKEHIFDHDTHCKNRSDDNM